MCSEVNPVGKLDAGNPHVQFDERGWETGLYATAPILDPTAWQNINQVGDSPQSLYDQAKKQGWTVIGLKTDRKRIFAFEQYMD